MAWDEFLLPSDFNLGIDPHFPSEVANDPWVIFHGTNSWSAEAIEAQGFLPSVSISYQKDIHHIISIYQVMDWVGNDLGGYGVLSSFSANFDLKYGRETGLLFFSDRFEQSLLYASADFSGGEKFRAIRRSVTDLNNYLENADVREQHMQSRHRTIERLQSLNAHPSMWKNIRTTPVDLEWLREQVGDINAAFQKVDLLADSQNQVVYALRMEPNDLHKFENAGSMGICSRFPVSAKKIVAKMIVPSDYRYPTCPQSNLEELSRDHAFRKSLKPIEREN